jgi:hypothetical protein
VNLENLFAVDDIEVGSVLVFLSRAKPDPRWYRVAAVLCRYRWLREDGARGDQAVELRGLHPDEEAVLIRNPQYLSIAATWHIVRGIEELMPEVKKKGEPLTGPPREVEVKRRTKGRPNGSWVPSRPSHQPF